MQWLALSPHNQSLHVLLVCVWVFCGHSDFLPQSKDMFHRLTDVSELGVSVKPCNGLVTHSGCVAPLPHSARVGSSNRAVTQKGIKQVLKIEYIYFNNGWIDDSKHKH